MNRKILLAVLTLAFILRFYHLGQNPPSLNWDEVSNAYNAYSILKTSRDEYGNFLPLTNRSFDDYKPLLYMYLNVPSVAVFDLTPFAVRFPSALFGTLTVLLVYFLTKKLFEKSVLPFTINKSPFTVTHLAALLLAVSPWHLQVSRAGFEANVGLFFAVAAFTSFIYAILLSNKNTSLLILSAILFGSSAYTYHSQRIFIPLMFLATILIYRKEIFTISKKYLAVFVTVLILLAVPIVFLMPNEAVSQRFESITLTSYTEDVQKSVDFINEDETVKFPLANLIHNRRVIIGIRYFKNYLANFDPNFLFVKGDDNFRHHIENMGMLYLWQLPLVLIGLYILIKERSKTSAFLIAWLVLSPVAAAPSNASPHALRSLTMIIPFTIFSAAGFTQIYNYLSFKKNFATFSFLIFTFSLFVYLHNYHIHYPRDFASFWQYGYLDAAKKTERLKSQYEKINISADIEQAYIFWLFATKYDPKTYQRSGSNLHFDKYYFKTEAPQNPDELYVAGNLDDSFEKVETIYLPNGQKTIEIGYRTVKPL